jgi:hypothetical protein
MKFDGKSEEGQTGGGALGGGPLAPFCSAALPINHNTAPPTAKPIRMIQPTIGPKKSIQIRIMNCIPRKERMIEPTPKKNM